MRKIAAIAWKDAMMRFTGWSEWLFFLVLPIVFTVILAGGSGPSTDTRIRLVIVDQARSALSTDFVALIEKSTTVRPDLLALAQAEEELNTRRTAAILIIPAEFDLAHLQQGPVALEMRELPNQLNALAAARAVQAAAGEIGSAVEIANASVSEVEKIRPFPSGAARSEAYAQALQAAQAGLSAAPARVKVVQGATPDPVGYDPRANSSAGQLITWVFIPLIGISGMFAYERQKGTLRRLLTTPTHKATFLIGMITGQVLMAIVQMLLLVGFGILVMKLDWGHSPAALGLMLVSSALAAASLGTALATFVKTEGQANGLSILFGMVMALLGGCWYPIELFPAFVQNAVRIFPTRWAMDGLLAIVLRGEGLNGILPDALVLLGFALVFFGVGIWRFRYE